MNCIFLLFFLEEKKGLTSIGLPYSSTTGVHSTKCKYLQQLSVTVYNYRWVIILNT